MYRKILKTVCFQVVTVACHFIASTTVLPAAVRADSAAVSVADSEAVRDTVSDSNGNNDSLDAVISTAVPDSGPLSEEKLSNKMETTEGADSSRQGERPGEHDNPLSNGPQKRRRFADFVTAVRKITGETFSEPLRFFSWIRLQRKKLLVLLVSVFIIYFTLSFYIQRVEKKRFLTTTRLSIMDKEVQRACRFVEKEFEDPDLDLRKICRELITGEAFLAALFIKELGLSVEDFITQVRINRAKIALRRNPGISSAALARSVGFTSEKEFVKQFKTIAGTDIDGYKETSESDIKETDLS